MNARFMKNAERKKGDASMLLQKLKMRLRMEYDAFRLYLVNGNLTSGELLCKAYEMVWKEEIVTLFECLPDNSYYTEDLISWIMGAPDALDFLYQAWRHTDYLLTAEFSELLHDELVIRKDGSNG